MPDEPVSASAASSLAHAGSQDEREAVSVLVKDFQTRFLYPFCFKPHVAKDLVASFAKDQITRKDGKSKPLWLANAKPCRLYTDELLGHVSRFLFPCDDSADGRAPSCPECAYLKVEPGTAQAWFRDTSLLPARSGARPLPVAMDADPGVELFLFPHGIGILSITLSPLRGKTAWELKVEDALAFNYRLSQFRRHDPARIRKRHPSDHPGTRTETPGDSAAIPPAPDDTARLDERLGAPGGVCNLKELVERLLQPLAAFGLPPKKIDEDLQELLVYTVLRLDAAADLRVPAVRERVAPVLSALAQVEEPEHAAGDDVTVPNVVLNSRHWAAVGLLGAGHVISDQPGNLAFNEQRKDVVRDKYFICHLLALFQQLKLNRTVEEAAPLVGDESPAAVLGLREMRKSLLNFAIKGHFTQISGRHALHRFYRICRRGLEVPETWREARRAIAELDADQAAQKADLTARKMDENLGIIAHVQVIVEYIEIFVVSAYAGHLWYMIAENNHGLVDWVRTNLFPISEAGLVHGGVILFAVVGAAVSTVVLRPWRLLKHGR